jgi:hypothetical protein
VLLTKTVILTWNVNNKKWYQSKGYKFTNYRDRFEVKTKDLSDGSHIEVEVQCDGCEKILNNIIWQSYKRNIKPDGKYYCKKCANKIIASEKFRETILKKGKSLEEWCIENNYQDILNRWDYELNILKPNEISHGSEGKDRKGFWLKCPRGIHKSELKKTDRISNDSPKCTCCNSFAQWGIDNICSDFLERYWDYEKNKDIDPWKLTNASNKDVWIKCQEKSYHNSYNLSVCEFTGRNYRCPYCTNRCGKVHSLDSLGTLYPQVLSIWSEKNEKTPYEYAPRSRYKIWWKCPEGKHDDYNRTIDISSRCDFRCPECTNERKESLIQEKTRLYLIELGYNVLHEHNCNIIAKNPKRIGTNFTLPYDNEIQELKLIIEVHGQQHYEGNSIWIDNWVKSKNMTQEEYLHYQQLKDRYKRIYAKSKGYNYLELPYWTFDENNTYKKLIDNKIQEILQSRAS